MVKVKCTLVEALRLCTGRTAHRGSRGLALLFHNHGTRSGWGVSVTPWPLFTLGKDSVPIVQEAGWAPGPVWTGAKNLANTRIRSLYRPARSQLLYWLSYTAHNSDGNRVLYSLAFVLNSSSWSATSIVKLVLCVCRWKTYSEIRVCTDYFELQTDTLPFASCLVFLLPQ